MNRVKSENQQNYCSCFGNIMHILNHGYERLALGFRVNYEKIVILITIQNISFRQTIKILF